MTAADTGLLTGVFVALAGGLISLFALESGYTRYVLIPTAILVICILEGVTIMQVSE